MSPYRPTNQRRRSLSVSPSTFHNHLCIDSCHSPAKRTHSRKDPPRHWDLDSWRREKRPRTQQNSPVLAASEPAQGVAAAVFTSTPQFPSTSAAFDLRPRDSRPPLSQPLRKPNSHSVIIDQNVSALHSYAFWELHQSITEASEGFVQRMRDWESSRPQAPRQTHRLNTPFPPYTPPRGCESASRTSSPSEVNSEDDDLDPDDEDDVLILSDEISSGTRASSLCAASSSKKRIRSLGDMDLDLPQMTPTIPPELSHTAASSSTSSLLSLAPPPAIPSPSSREEKVIAALTLALANGAAGLNDYGAVREALGVSAPHAEGASEVGEMWW
ncbi:hypothetical protein DFH94DRAFT_692190 [Russula ochroleuca]|jgi:hypothetical protein|uniref:Uncharacterized protein n=1 Tax=Russula ochroleuca TaxID=152965 RepID=A0A9P5MXR6_9AGAM|nr:hypothetical protein DFH94DRAFT_692190 [Russula ochroleuca]